MMNTTTQTQPKGHSRAYCGNTAIGIVMGSIYYQCEFLASCLFRLQCTVSIYKSSNPHCQRRSIDRWLGYSAALHPATVHAQPMSSSSSRFRFLVFSSAFKLWWLAHFLSSSGLLLLSSSSDLCNEIGFIFWRWGNKNSSLILTTFVFFLKELEGPWPLLDIY